jgi:hypothetical protein
VTTVGVILAAAIGILPQILNSTPAELSISVHITDQNSGSSIQGAKVLLFLDGNPFVAHTDSNGTSTFSVTVPKNTLARLFVEMDQYEIYDANVKLSGNSNIDIPLTLRGSNDRKIVVRVVDNNTNAPIDGAKVVLIESGNTYSQSTDSNGLADFTITFANENIEADITVSTAQSTINRQRVTLRPDEVQDVRLSQATNEIIVTSLESSISTPAAGEKSVAYGQIIAGALSVPTQIDKYTFTGNANDVVLIVLAKTSGDFWPQIRLYGPDGKEIRTVKSGGINVELNETLPMAGEYVILVSDGWNGTQVGDYSINLQKIQ